jgi:raffinose/stachyose/melibiose transport system substrate-binding protein
MHRLVVYHPDIFEQVAQGKIKYTDAVFVDTFRDIHDFLKKGYISKDVLGLSDDAALSQFRQQKTAMLLQGEFTMISLSGDNDPGFELGVFPIPYNKKDEEIVIPITIYSSEAVAASSKHPDAALKFEAYLSSPEGAALVADYLGAFSPVIGAPLDFNPLVKLWQPLLSRKSANFYHSLQDSAVQAEMLKGVQLLLQEEISPEELGRIVQDAQDKKNN